MAYVRKVVDKKYRKNRAAFLPLILNDALTDPWLSESDTVAQAQDASTMLNRWEMEPAPTLKPGDNHNTMPPTRRYF